MNLSKYDFASVTQSKWKCLASPFFGFMSLFSYCSFDVMGGECLRICKLCFYHTQQCPHASLPCLPTHFVLIFKTYRNTSLKPPFPRP